MSGDLLLKTKIPGLLRVLVVVVSLAALATAGPQSYAAEHPLAGRRGLRPAPGLLRHEAGLDAEPRPAGGRGRALHASLHHRAGLLAQPVGVHDRHVPDHHRRPQPPLAPRRRLPAARRACGSLTDWMRDAGYFTANVRDLPARRSASRARGKTDWNFTYDGQAVRFGPLGGSEGAPAVLRAGQFPGDAPHVPSPRRRPTRPRS